MSEEQLKEILEQVRKLRNNQKKREQHKREQDKNEESDSKAKEGISVTSK